MEVLRRFMEISLLLLTMMMVIINVRLID